MPYLEHRQRLHRLLQGEHPLGRGEGCAVQIQGIPTGRYAVLRASESGVYLRALSGKLRLEVNGEPVTSKGRALSHGDRIRLGKAELLFIDETQVGGTATAEAASPVQEAEETEGEGLADYADAGGMLTRRRDGSRLPVAAPLFRIGREAGCDLVVPESAVSRVHAEVRYQGGKYVLYDL
ncbi:MAG: FHA domain-containing protein, partial [Armatimonadota bacterium]